MFFSHELSPALVLAGVSVVTRKCARVEHYRPDTRLHVYVLRSRLRASTCNECRCTLSIHAPEVDAVSKSSSSSAPPRFSSDCLPFSAAAASTPLREKIKKKMSAFFSNLSMSFSIFSIEGNSSRKSYPVRAIMFAAFENPSSRRNFLI